MFNLFRKSPAFVDKEFSDLSRMLTQDTRLPTYKRELLDEKKLDFSVDSLKHIDAYLETLHGTPPQQQDLAVVVLRTGAYAGEVIRKKSSEKMHWIAFEEAAKHSEFVKGLGKSLGTAGILWTNPKTMCFPLAKVGKFLQNRSEDSLYFFAKMILEAPHAKPAAKS
jgi:hypothetical protein